MTERPGAAPTVYLVDDDAAVRDALALLLGSVDLHVQTFPDGPALLGALRPDACGCLLLDLRLPHISGLQLQLTLQARGVDLPVILMTGHGDVDLCRRAFRQGAADFLTKPVNDTALLDAVQRAVGAHAQLRAQRAAEADARARLARLTDREQAVLRGVMQGETGKQTARTLGISVRTVETHRASLFAKLEVTSVAALMRTYLGVSGPERGSP